MWDLTRRCEHSQSHYSVLATMSNDPTHADADDETEPSILLPTKVYQHIQEDGRLVHHVYPNSIVRWTAQPVVEWVEHLAAAVENAEGSTRPITINGVELSEPSPSWRLAHPKPSSTLWVQPDEQASNDPNDWTNVPKHWDVSFLQQRDPSSWSAAQRMSHLAVQIESLPALDLAQYEMVHTRLEFTFGRILAQFPHGTPPEHGELRYLLDTLYNDTARKLQEVLKHATDPPPPKGPIREMPQVPTIAKKDFGKYMTQWLLENWTNPYPDEDGLEYMSRECGVTPTVVSNWLINARTRKWRPSIVKATQLTRPSAMLLEDSIALFQNIPLRQLLDHPEDGDDATRRRFKRVKTTY